ncbi:MAG: Gfo/Idh/MocA family oxidoreductase [Rhodospirillales bacterium]|nr:Gfo/Idh/MocA family oxidoreductase [Rhodospirillales bacterium]
MAGNTVRIGILGADAMGAEHAGAYAGISGVEVAGVVARDTERARPVAEICGAQPFADATALMESETVDAIDICVPTAAGRAAHEIGGSV